MNQQSMTFTTDPGHPLHPGTITFSASAAGSGINFNIDLAGKLSNVTSVIGFHTLGSEFEDAQWMHFNSQIENFCKVGR
jgi:hypothetical protein